MPVPAGLLAGLVTRPRAAQTADGPAATAGPAVLNVGEIRAEGPGADGGGGRVTLSGQTLTARRASTVR